MKKIHAVMATMLLLASGPSWAGEGKEHNKEKYSKTEMNNAQQSAKQSDYPQSVQDVVRDWPQKQRDVVQKMIEQYGEPSGVMPSRIVWEEPAEPWSEVIVYRKAVDHNFPIPHQDFLEQSIYHQVPEDKMEELAKFDGSVIVYQTEGRMAARCDKEAANILALNLAHDIIVGEKSVDEARASYAEAVAQMKAGEAPKIVQQLTFEPAAPGKAADPDFAVIDPSQLN